MSILVTGAAGRVGAVGRMIAELLLKEGKAVRAMVRNDDQRAQALRDIGAEVVVGNMLDLDSMHQAIDGCETMYFGLSVSEDYLAATVNTAAVAKHHGVKAFINMSQMTLSQMSITQTTASPQHKLHWLAEPRDHFSGHPRRTVARRTARTRVAVSPREPPRNDGRSAPGWTIRPPVGRRIQTHRATAAFRAGVRQEQRGGIHGRARNAHEESTRGIGSLTERSLRSSSTAPYADFLPGRASVGSEHQSKGERT